MFGYVDPMGIDYMTLQRVYGPYTLLGLQQDMPYGLKFGGSFGLRGNTCELCNPRHPKYRIDAYLVESVVLWTGLRPSRIIYWPYDICIYIYTHMYTHV